MNMKKTVKLTETDIEKLVSKIMKENNQEIINEVGGYDSLELSQFHGESVMDSIREVLTTMIESMNYLSTLKLDIVDDTFNKATEQFTNQQNVILNKYAKMWVDTEKRRHSN